MGQSGGRQEARGGERAFVLKRTKRRKTGASRQGGTAKVGHWLCQCLFGLLSNDGSLRQTVDHRQLRVLLFWWNVEVISGRRPFPVHGTTTKPPTDRVVVDVRQEAEMASGENRFQSKPGPSCQDRKQFPGRSRTVSFDNSLEPCPIRSSLIRIENGCLIRAR